MFTLAHLSDPHLAPLPWPGAGALLGKRALGYLNWKRQRERIHRLDILGEIVADLQAQRPDHIACTGDLINISMPDEYRRARHWLGTLGEPDRVSLVPGNHDAYVPAHADAPVTHWGDHSRGDDGASFPFLRRRGRVAIIGVSSAVPTAPLMASGLVGPTQRAKLAALLAAAAREGLFRVVMIHHPPRRKTGHHKRLVDAKELRSLLAEHGAELLIHGHDHINSVEYLDTPQGRLPMIGVPSASATANSEEAAGYNLYRISGEPGRWRCEVISRGFRGHSVVEANRIAFAA